MACGGDPSKIELPDNLSSQLPVDWWGDEEDKNLLYGTFLMGTAHCDEVLGAVVPIS